jgi:tetratricopeptide (TPR) repeat protein
MTSSPAVAGSSSVERELHRIRSLLKERRFDAAVAAAAVLEAEVPENRDVLYLLALGERQARRLTDALATLERLERHHPNFSRLYQERGHCYVAMKNAEAAIQAYQKAVQVNGALPATWSMLEGLYRMIGDGANAAAAAAEVATLKSMAPEVITATGLFADGDIVGAEKLIRAFLLTHGDHIEAMRLLARIGVALEVFDDAEYLLAAVLERAPDYLAARHDYGCVLLDRHKHAAARAEFEKLLAREPGKREYLTMYAAAIVGLGQHNKAVELYRELLANPANDARVRAELHLSIAHSLKTEGRRDEAIASYRAAAAQRPDFGDAYWSLANLKTYRFTDDELARLVIAEAEPGTAPVDRYHLSFALGKAYEDRRDYQRSWQFYERGNALKRTGSRYRAELIELNTANQKKVCTREFFAHRTGPGVPSREPIFILGLPRSGSTLVEQILSSHSRVEGTQELGDIPRVAMELQGRDPDLDNPRYPGVLQEMPIEEFQRLGEKYLADTRVYRTGKPHFIDKMPNNFRHIGLIHLMLPNAKIIDARREPLACCFSNLKQLYARGQEFTYSIEGVARYYRTYLELMRHWDEVLPGRILRVQHEDVVDDLDGNVRRILDFCDLRFEPACVDFYKTERSVRTASSEQVRQPIFREGLDQWRHYEQWLAPLKDALGDALASYRR